MISNFDAGEELQRDRFDRHRRHREEVREHGEAERDRDRHAGQHQAEQSAKMIHGFAIATPASFSATGIPIKSGGMSAGQRGASAGTGAYRCSVGAHLCGLIAVARSAGMQVVGHAVRVDVLRRLDALDVRDVMVRQLARPHERPGDLQEAESTSGTSRAECRGRRSTSAARDPATPSPCARCPRRTSRPACRRCR